VAKNTKNEYKKKKKRRVKVCWEGGGKARRQSSANREKELRNNAGLRRPEKEKQGTARGKRKKRVDVFEEERAQGSL